MPQQDLDRPQVCPRLQQMRGEAVAQSVWRDMLFDASFSRSFLHCHPNHFGRDRFVGTPTIDRTGEQVSLRSHPAPVLAQGGEQLLIERDLPIHSTLVTLNTNHHAAAIDIPSGDTVHCAAVQPSTSSAAW